MTLENKLEKKSKESLDCFFIVNKSSKLLGLSTVLHSKCLQIWAPAKNQEMNVAFINAFTHG